MTWNYLKEGIFEHLITPGAMLDSVDTQSCTNGKLYCIGLAKNFLWVFQHLMEKPEWTFWPIQYTEWQIFSGTYGALYAVCVVSRYSPVWLFATPWTVALQALLSVGFSRKDSREIFVVPLRKEHLIRSSQHLALLATESVGILARLVPATAQWVRRPQSEWSDKENWGLLRFLSLMFKWSLWPSSILHAFRTWGLLSFLL